MEREDYEEENRDFMSEGDGAAAVSEETAAEEEGGSDEDSMIWDDQNFETPLDIAEETFQYVCGWLAKDFRVEFSNIPNLGPLAFPTEHFPIEYGELPVWLATQSRGGLMCPTPNFVKLVKDFDVYFSTMHGREISLAFRVLHTLKDTLCQKFPLIPEKLVMRYTKFRTFTRMRLLEHHFQEEQRKKREENLAKRAAKLAAAVAAKAAKAAAVAGAEAGAASGGAPVAGTSHTPVAGTSQRPAPPSGSAGRRERRKRGEFGGK